MILKLIYEEHSDIYFYFGVFSKADYEFIYSKLRCFNFELNNPSNNDFQFFDELMNIYENKCELIDEVNNRLSKDYVLESILEANHIYCKNEIIEMTQKFENDKLSSAISLVKHVKLFDTLRRNAKQIVFILTESYFKSTFFVADLNEAQVKLKKEIIFLVDERIKDFDSHNFPDIKTFSISKDIFYPFDFLDFVKPKIHVAKKASNF